MPRNIVILLDGTSNQITADRSNVLRLYGGLTKNDEQLVYYDPGVGTFGLADGSSWRSALWKFWGMATGYGLDDNVKQAYRFLVENYRKDGEPDENGNTRDRIYIIGFSRGAYSARVLAGFINALGLIEPRSLNLLDYAYRDYKRIGEGGEGEHAFATMRLYERTLRPDRPPVRMLGLFDTVASVIERGPLLWRLKSHAYTDRNPSVESVFQAFAIDDVRTMFRPIHWEEGQEYWGSAFRHEAGARPQEVEQVWFPGYHADVGGGHPEGESGLAKVPLLWLIDKAKTSNLKFSTRSVNALILGKGEDNPRVAPDPLGPKHNSLKWFWVPFEFIPRRKPKRSRRWSVLGWVLPLFEKRNVPEGAKLHRSLADRKAQLGEWPDNAPEKYELVD
ncbi:DUF2235 domain-containing protein [Aurantiacibacter sp. D1-12]|uniref:DUF2235 domain-containing protein n=1 Tax=Aurantiacibacter sp. D1-12 TaxID=2993658 RepID=UPI00237C8615|nr:DUF2235 domain-containing protein [Aurantiacibacter sp. D1-12]MDE1467640.1 DUF2235 domain-containing protein [Aurantiacibacter sp. D1-12]